MAVPFLVVLVVPPEAGGTALFRRQLKYEKGVLICKNNFIID
jgi:hypothetical protein